MATKYTHCDICLAACGMEVEVEENRIVALRGDKDHPLTRGFLCPKGMASQEMVTDPLRLRHPYEKTGSTWNRITWPEAYRKISQRLRNLISNHGKNSVALYYGGGNATSSVNYMLADGFLRALGSDRIYNVLTLELHEPVSGHGEDVRQTIPCHPSRRRPNGLPPHLLKRRPAYVASLPRRFCGSQKNSPRPGPLVRSASSVSMSPRTAR